MNYQFEICANSVESCIAAQQGGAHRVELCAGIPEGGTTPSIGEIKTARKMIDIKLHVIIRPRGGDFLYSPIEKNSMIEDIYAAREAEADGLVFGALTPDGDIDLPRLSRHFPPRIRPLQGPYPRIGRDYRLRSRTHPYFWSAAYSSAGRRPYP